MDGDDDAEDDGDDDGEDEEEEEGEECHFFVESGDSGDVCFAGLKLLYQHLRFLQGRIVIHNLRSS